MVPERKGKMQRYTGQVILSLDERPQESHHQSSKNWGPHRRIFGDGCSLEPVANKGWSELAPWEKEFNEGLKGDDINS